MAVMSTLLCLAKYNQTSNTTVYVRKHMGEFVKQMT